jgi:hypothetical protein
LSVVSCTTFNTCFDDAPDWTRLIVGTYAGEVWSTHEMLPIETTFKISGEGSLNGSYRIIGDNSMIEGTLHQFKTEGPTHLKCIWQDPYGKGSLALTFSKDYSRFDGLWQFEEPEGEHPWNGKKRE